MCGNVWKCSEMLRTVWKCLEMFRNVWKCVEMCGNIQKLGKLCIDFGNHGIWKSIDLKEKFAYKR